GGTRLTERGDQEIAVQFHHPASHLPSLRRRSAKQEILMISWSLQIVARKVSSSLLIILQYTQQQP
ncbi:hypothetical protein, partial [Deinococcus saxicola]|uniref:hypothetical protein n=1 Tax=Deinococcus saxicola TaxID=249406 RepID=UPI0039F1293D